MEEETTSTQPSYNALFVFGDSLSDNGAVFAFTGGSFPPTELTGTDTNGNPVDFAERDIFFNNNFTNGSVYADISADLLGIPGDTSTVYDDLMGSNLAVGGGTATDLTAFGGTANSTLAQQVSTFQLGLTGLTGTEEENAAFLNGSAASIFIGLNDLSALAGVATAGGSIDQLALAQGIGVILAEIQSQAEILAATGIGTLVLNALPGGSFFPNSNALIDAFGPGTDVLFDQVSAQINAGLAAIGAGLAANGVQVEMVDFFALAQEIQADAESYGFLTLENALPNSDAETTLLISDIPIDQVGFIDPVHFTAELHQVFGAFQARTLGDNQIKGDAMGGIIQGTEADDTIFALAGRDIIRGDAGNDLIFGGADNDVVFAGTDDDIVLGGTGNDLLLGQDGGDVLGGGAGNDILFAGAGDDVVAGNAGNDFVNGGTGNDLLVDGLGNDVVAGGAGDDIVIYFSADQIGGVVGENSDLFFGGAGDDTLLVVSEAAIADVDAYLVTNGVMATGFETVTAVTLDELAEVDFGSLVGQLEMAGLFGLV